MEFEAKFGELWATRTLRESGQENNSRLCGIWGKIWRALGTKKNTKVTLRYGTGVALTLSAVQVDILSHRVRCVDTKRDHARQENTSRLCGIWGKIWRALGKNTKATERCCIDTKRDHARQENNSRLCGIWGKIWRALGTKKNTKVTLRYGTGVALTLSAVQVDILSHRCCVDTGQEKEQKTWARLRGQENNSRLCGIWGKIWRALGTKKNTKVTLRYGTGVALTLSAVQVDILSHRCCVDTKRDHARQENNSRLCGIWGKIWRALGTKKNTKVTLQQEENSRLCGIWGKIWRALGTKKNQKSHCVTEQVLHWH